MVGAELSYSFSLVYQKEQYSTCHRILSMKLSQAQAQLPAQAQVYPQSPVLALETKLNEPKLKRDRMNTYISPT